ncbi:MULTISPECIES: phosphatidate cytidylyltransferase [unclassified Marinobacter]|uniref:phosphatidate cytidylyltransferase n=1 Tax=unclassified Marinobacter TaxID=83889 RepID=UPI000BFA7BBD|nr:MULTISPECIES: phosphatidate cytidylyltransferase [unclassified Marinobacter]PFG07977.1 phosphatidate cytidylyltransferase [Marinobacter sp. LV10MA510-1]PFG53796.1 phosphatidate cytidylyltransferase [Marinobacter sp. LV10R520-4]
MLKTRIITALILAPIAIGGVFFLPPVGFAIFTAALIALGAWEWANMAGLTTQPTRVCYSAAVLLVLAALYAITAQGVLWLALFWWLAGFGLVAYYPKGSARWGSVPARAAMGLLVLVPAWVGLNYLRSGEFKFALTDNNLLLILYVFALVWVADIGAYFSGRKFGKAKLAPRVSPGKSWAGVWGGLTAVAVFSLVVGQTLGAGAGQTVALIIISVVTAAVSVLGDLFESMFKRFRGIKDSSRLLPGHGGIMDRIDSLTAAIPIFTLLVIQLGWLNVGPLS